MRTFVTVRHRVVTRDGVDVLVLSLDGAYGAGSSGRPDAEALEARIAELCAATPGPDVAVLDGARFGYVGGDEIDWLTSSLEGRAWLWAASDGCAPALESWFGAARVTASLDAALEKLSRWRHAGRFTLGAQSFEWTPRGFRELEAGLETLWARRRLVERTSRGPDGAVKWQAFWPFADETGHRGQACELGARIVVEAGAVTTVDFDPHHTGASLPPQWVERVAPLSSLRELGLLGTTAGDDDVARALAVLPELTEVTLVRTRVTDRTLDALAGGLAPKLERVFVDSCDITPEGADRLQRGRPRLHVVGVTGRP